MAGAFKFAVENGLARLTFDQPGEKINKFSASVVTEFELLIGRLELSTDIQALVFRSGKPDGFAAGADVREIENIASPEDGAAKSAIGERLFDRWSRLPFPTIAAISGVCLGGGLELALACDYRIASDSAKTRLGLPEVQLGILPGWGGTQRLPRLLGLAAALDLILTGRSIDGRRARKIGLVDECVPEPIFGEWAESFARGKFGAIKPRGFRPKLSLGGRFLNGTPPGRAIVHSRARRSVLAKTGGHYPAPLEALAAATEGYGKRIDEGLAIENRHFRNLIGSPIQKNLLRIFNWTERKKKENGSRDPAVIPREVTRVGVLGAGVMGGGIAQLAADRGIPTRMKDIAAEPLLHGFATAAQLWKDSIRRKHRPPREFDAKMAMLSGGFDYAGFAGAEITMEAVVEKLSVKRSVLSEWETAVPEDRIFASNTSTIPITDIADGAQNPRRVIGLHFFNPVHRMPLVEVIVGEKTSDQTVATTFAFARRLGKTPVVVRDAPGFLVNRVLAPYLSEAVRLLEDGCAVEEIDRVMTGFGMPVGPLALLDDVGIDVASKGGETMAQAFPSRLPRSARFEALLHAGHLGRKTARGFYRYDGRRRAGAEPSIYAELSLPAPRKDALPPEVIESRLILPMINEAAFCLEDRIVDSPDRVDLAMIFGTGFPAFRGGLLCHADALGIDRVVHRLEDLAERLGERFAPAPRLIAMQRERRSFYSAA